MKIKVSKDTKEKKVIEENNGAISYEDICDLIELGERTERIMRDHKRRMGKNPGFMKLYIQEMGEIQLVNLYGSNKVKDIGRRLGIGKDLLKIFNEKLEALKEK